jgi:peptidoglycan/LPS O-acetylase OafA/YrhL
LRLDQLDGLRAIAALIVVAFHTKLPGFAGGFIGVDIFFVLSGFLITQLLRTELDDTGTIDYATFMKRRFIRLYPALLISTLTFVALIPLLFPKSQPLRETLLPLLYLTDYSRALYETKTIMQHTWSLSVEAHFYLLWPLAIYALRNASNDTVFRAMIALFVAATAWRWLSAEFASSWIRTYYAFDTRLSGLLLGAALAAVRWRPTANQANQLTFVSAATLIFFCITLRHGKDPSLTSAALFVDLASAGLVLALLVPTSLITRVLSWQPLVHIGTWSYALYLWHYPIANLTRNAFPAPIAFLITLSLGLTLAALTHQFIEKPFARWSRGRQQPQFA